MATGKASNLMELIRKRNDAALTRMEAKNLLRLIQSRIQRPKFDVQSPEVEAIAAMSVAVGVRMVPVFALLS